VNLTPPQGIAKAVLTRDGFVKAIEIRIAYGSGTYDLRFYSWGSTVPVRPKPAPRRCRSTRRKADIQPFI
jgi:hypothetical protein